MAKREHISGLYTQLAIHRIYFDEAIQKLYIEENIYDIMINVKNGL